MSKDKDKKKPGNENFEVLVQLFPWLEEQEGGPGGAPGGKKPGKDSVHLHTIVL